MTDDQRYMWVNCKQCEHVWGALRLPMKMSKAAKIMIKLCCPNCGADAKEIRVGGGKQMAKWSDEKVADLTRRLADTAIDYKHRCAELEAQNRLLRDAVYIDDLSVTWMAEDKAALKARIEKLEAKLAKAVEAAFYEGFCEGRDGGWVWGDPTPAWKKSEALAELKEQDDE